MRALIGLLLAFAAGVCPAAEVYRWVDDEGVVNYGEKPPANRPAQPVKTEPGGTIESGLPYGKKADPASRNAASSAQRPQVAADPSAVPPPPAGARGMEFDTYIRLQQGMTEGELLLRAGGPDHQTLDSIYGDIMKTFYYLPTTANPYTTVVTLRGGRIYSLERIRKLW
jgi:hypothetical protein